MKPPKDCEECGSWKIGRYGYHHCLKHLILAIDNYPKRPFWCPLRTRRLKGIYIGAGDKVSVSAHRKKCTLSVSEKDKEHDYNLWYRQDLTLSEAIELRDWLNQWIDIKEVKDVE